MATQRISASKLLVELDSDAAFTTLFKRRVEYGQQKLIKRLFDFMRGKTAFDGIGLSLIPGARLVAVIKDDDKHLKAAYNEFLVARFEKAVEPEKPEPAVVPLRVAPVDPAEGDQPVGVTRLPRVTRE